MATAFQSNAFQNNAFQIAAPGIPITPRGFDETLAAFRIARRRELEEREINQLLELEADLVRRALMPFVGGPGDET